MKYFVTIILVLLVAVVVSKQLWKDYDQKDIAMSKREGFQMQPGRVEVYDVQQGAYKEVDKVIKSKEEWKEVLTDEEFHVAFEQGTERPFTSELNKNKRKGVYRAKACGVDLFHSDHKFDSGTGWPSFYKPVDEKNIILVEDNSLFMRRTEVIDAVCGSHLGHVFNDGPPPTGLRYCINGDVLEFVEGVEYKEPENEE